METDLMTYADRADRAETQALETRAHAAYDACPTVKPKWEQLGGVTKQVWIDALQRQKQS